MRRADLARIAALCKDHGCLDALRALDIRVIDLPATEEQVLRSSSGRVVQRLTLPSPYADLGPRLAAAAEEAAKGKG